MNDSLSKLFGLSALFVVWICSPVFSQTGPGSPAPTNGTVNPVPCVGLDCNIETPEEPTEVEPPPPPFDPFENECVHPNGQLYRDHWFACSDTVDTLGLVANVLQAQRDYALMELGMCLEPPEPEGIECDFRESFFDGNGGNLWKPFSDNTGRPVVLTAVNTVGSNCEIQTSDGQSFLGCTFRTIANGNRAHWDVPVVCSSVPDGSFFVLTKDGQKSCWEITSSCDRLD